MNGVFGDASATLPGSAVSEGGGMMWCWPEPADMEEECDEVGTIVAVCSDGVGGPEEDGEIGSVTHNR